MFLTNPVTIWYTCTVCVSKPPRLGMLDVRTILALFFSDKVVKSANGKILKTPSSNVCFAPCYYLCAAATIFLATCWAF